ncbi:MAG TPA: ATP-binding protein [Sphingomicrobium sp.]
MEANISDAEPAQSLDHLDRYRILFDSMDEGFCIIEFLDSEHGPLSDYIHIEANAAYAINAGIPNVVGQKLREMVPDEADAWIARYGEVLRTGEPIRFEQELIATGRYLELSAFRLGPAEDRLVAVLFKDVTARRKAEEELRKLNETLEARVVEEIAERRAAEVALQRAQKLESIGKLTGGVAHDFNNLLQIISGNLQLLGTDVAGNARAERRIANAMAGVQRGAKLASQLLAFGRRQPLEPKVANIGRLVAGMEDLLRRSIGEAVEMETVVSGGLWNTFVDPNQIENAVLNLAINARDAMDGMGKLTIEVRNAILDHDYAAANHEIEPGQYVMLAVSDTGTGIPADIVEHVFEPFFTTKPEGKGSGLGLSMVYGFMKQSGGHVKIYSEEGQGTTVKLYLPRVHGAEDVAVGSEPVDAGGGTETILVVEDDEEVRSTVTELLRNLGYTVLTAKDAASAFPILESGVKVDLLFTDVVMPGPLRSPELARKARERLPGIAVLFTSGYTENAIVHGGRLDPGVNLLTKPYSRQALASRIRDALNRRAPD